MHSNDPINVAMFVLNTFSHDSRVIKEAKSLLNAGYKVTVFAVLDKGFQARENFEGIEVIRYPLHTKYLKRIKDMLRKKKRKKTSANPGAAKSPTPKLGFLEQCYESLKNTWLGSRVLLFDYWKYYRRCLNEIERRSFAVFHAHDLNCLLLGVMAKQRYGGKLIYDSHELFLERIFESHHQKKYFRRIEESQIQVADSVITVCDSIGSELSERYKIEFPTILRNCPDQIESFRKSNLIGEKLKLPAKTPIILYQGGYARGRGLFELIESVKYLDQGVLVFMGWGNIEQDLRHTTDALGLSDRIFFIEPVSVNDLLEWTSSADIGVIPYKNVSLNNYYSCPNKLFEYINARVLVAGSFFPEISRIVNNYQIGETFDPDRPSSIAEAINELTRNRIGTKESTVQLEKASSELNWQLESKKLLAIYEFYRKSA